MTVTELMPAARASWQMIADRLEAETDPRRKALLAVVAEHVEAEVRGDVDALMQTLVDDPQYHFYGAQGTDGPKGHDNVIAHYNGLNAAGMNRLEFDVFRVVVDDDHVITEGWFRHAVPPMIAEMLTGTKPEHGYGMPPEWYLVEYLCLVVWPATPEGKLIGEDIYFGTPPRIVRPLAPGEAPHLGPPERA
jgi:limonene-1,2-epoxide hydrolase